MPRPRDLAERPDVSPGDTIGSHDRALDTLAAPRPGRARRPGRSHVASWSRLPPWSHLPSWSHRSSTWWHRVRLVAAALVMGGAIAFMVVKFQELESAAGQLTHVQVDWLLVAILAEAGSMVAFAGLQRRLLRAAGSTVPLGRMTALTVASNSIDATFPGGVAWAAAWLWNQLGRWGVNRFQRVWVFLVAGGVSSFALFLVVGSGVEIAGSHGPVAGLRWLVFLLALIPLLILVLELFHRTRLVQALRAWAVGHLSADVPGGQRVLRGVGALVERFVAVRLRPLGWLEVLALALLNWLLDCAVVVATLEALRIAVPWDAILVIYGLTQISAAFPLTPGGIGIVAGSLGALLHAYGVPAMDALSAVILYRVLTFYFLVPLGWGVFGIFELLARQHRQPAGAPAGARSGAPRGVPGAVPAQLSRHSG